MDHDLFTVRDAVRSGRAAQLLFVLLGLALLPVFLLTYPPQTHKLPLFGTGPGAESASRLHRLELDADGTIRWETKPVDPIALRMCLELTDTIPGHGVDFRPDPQARYEAFLEVLAVIRRSGLAHLRIDNRRFRRAIDEDAPAARIPPSPGPIAPIPARTLQLPLSLPCTEVESAFS